MNEKERYIKIGQDFIDKMTEQQERRIVEIVDNSPKAGYYKLLAAEFGIPQRAVRFVYNKLRSEGKLRDKVHNRWSSKEIESIQQKIEEGHSILEISIALNKHASSIRKKVRELYGCIPVIEIAGEEWRTIYDNYEISNFGRIRRIGQRKLLDGSINSDGYIRIGLNTKSGYINKFIHNLVAEAFIANADSKPLVDHIDGNRLNNNVSNLRWATAEENANNIHRLQLLSEQAEAKRIEKRINNCLKEIFDCGISKLDLIRRIVDYKEDDIQKGGNIL